MVYSIAILHSIVEFHRSTSFSIYVVVEGRRLLRWHGIEKKAMPFSVFHSWLERLLVFFFLARLALAVETAAATRHLSVREALGRR